MGSSGLGGLFIIPILVFIIDRIRRKLLINFGLLLLIALSMVFLLNIKSYLIFAGIRFFQGSVIALFIICYVTIISNLLPAKIRANGFALFGIAGILPFIISVGFGEKLYFLFGFDFIVCLSIVFFLSALVFLIFVRESHDLDTHKKSSHLLSLLKMLKVKAIYPYLFWTFSLGSTFGLFLTLLPGLFYAKGIRQISDFWISYPIIVILIRVLYGMYFTDEFVKKMLFVPIACLSLSLFIVTLINHSFFVFIPGIIYGISHGFLFPVLSAGLISHAIPSFRGRMSLLFQSFNSLGLFFSSTAGGFLADHFSVESPFLIFSLYNLTGLVLLFYLYKIKKKF